MSLDQFKTEDLLSVSLEILKAELAGRARLIRFENKEQELALTLFAGEDPWGERQELKKADSGWIWMTQANRDRLMSAIRAEIEARELEELLSRLRPRNKNNEARL